MSEWWEGVIDAVPTGEGVDSLNVVDNGVHTDAPCNIKLH